MIHLFICDVVNHFRDINYFSSYFLNVFSRVDTNILSNVRWLTVKYRPVKQISQHLAFKFNSMNVKYNEKWFDNLFDDMGGFIYTKFCNDSKI